jgi:uncharacterized repeat protein (TIGR03803 family)
MTRISYAASLALSAAILASLTLPAAAATEKVLWNFQGAKLGSPVGRLLLRKSTGALFGTGSSADNGYGQVFRLTPSGGIWKIKTLVKFTGSNGANPEAGLISDSTGALYGTTHDGGAYGYGTVFKLSVSGGIWTETVLYNFTGSSDGANPYCDLVMDSSGALYGTTENGGSNGWGTVFELARSGGTWTETVLHSFNSFYGDGATPVAGLHRDAASGILYGTTSSSDQGGTVFALSQSGSVWLYEVIYDFTGGADGAGPNAGVIEGPKHNLYGTTYAGGAYGYGTVFELVSGFDWTEKVLYSFTGGSDGSNPLAALHLDTSGALYGTTYVGGTNGAGVVFKLTQSGGVWTESVLHDFDDPISDGDLPEAGVIADSAGNLYGTTYDGVDFGTVYEITP